MRSSRMPHKHLDRVQLPTPEMNLLCCGDLHFREHLGYADYIADGRLSEKKEILDFIIEQGKDCQGVVMLGDQFHLKNNPSEVIREFVEFVEAFGDKEIYILAGNHEKHGNGKSAIDFMKEIKKPNWHVITDKIEEKDGLVFCPYFFKGEMGVNTLKGATAKVTKSLPDGRVLFIHHAISDIEFGGINTNMLVREIVVSKSTLEKKYELVVAGHIHGPSKNEKIVMAGSIFNNELGESDKKIYKLSMGKELKIKEIPLPGRAIVKMEDPTDADIKKIKKNSIVKVFLSKATERKGIIALKEKLAPQCDAYIIVEKFKGEREKAHVDSVMTMGIEDLLKIYAKEKKIPVDKLLNGFNLVK